MQGKMEWAVRLDNDSIVFMGRKIDAENALTLYPTGRLVPVRHISA